MKNFVKRLWIYIIILIVIFISIELSYSWIPNDYSFKAKILAENAEQIETLILGNSHAYYGLNPLVFGETSTFNLDHVSQSIDLDKFLVESYLDKMDLKTIIIPLSYFSLYSKLEETSGAWMIVDFHYAYNYSPTDWKNRLYVFQPDLRGKLKSILKFLFSDYDRVYVDNLGFGPNRSEQRDFSVTAESAVKRHTRKKDLQGMSYKELPMFWELNGLIKQAKAFNVNVILVSLPVHNDYYKRLDLNQLEDILLAGSELSSIYSNCTYLNYFQFPLEDRCFFDADHLNHRGADRISSEIIKALNHNEIK